MTSDRRIKENVTSSAVWSGRMIERLQEKKPLLRSLFSSPGIKGVACLICAVHYANGWLVEQF